MNKIAIIIQREFFTRVRKRSFIIMSILGPVIFAAFLIVPTWMSQMEDTGEKIIAVIDSSKIFINALPETETIKFEYLENASIEKIKKNFAQTPYYGVLYIAHTVSYVNNSVKLYSNKQPNLSVRMHIANAIEKRLEKEKLLAHNIPDLDAILKSVETPISIQTIKWSDNGEDKEGLTETAMITGYICGFLIYLFIFMFGVQVMRGVIEEKSSRIVEVIVSSVKPFQLMMGKILGIAMVGLTQFVIWISLTIFLFIYVQSMLLPEIKAPVKENAPVENIITSKPAIDNMQGMTSENNAGNQQTDEIKNVFQSIRNLNFSLIIISFLFYFLGGYLLYASLFALVGSAADAETDTQQFMMPITIPLILSIFVMMNVINNPESSMAIWFSMIPLTSPIVMMARVPFDPPAWQLALSGIILIGSFIGTTWLAGKIYRTGILMYGKKVNYKELWKWLRYKN